MAEVPVTMNGMLYDLYNRTTQRVVFIGDASLTGLGVGGGPIMPPSQPPGGGGAPEHPIYYPDRIWGGGNVPMPNPPIYLPQPPEPPVDGGDKPPPASGGWGFVAEWGAWGYFPMGSGAAPKRP